MALTRLGATDGVRPSIAGPFTNVALNCVLEEHPADSVYSAEAFEAGKLLDLSGNGHHATVEVPPPPPPPPPPRGSPCSPSSQLAASHFCPPPRRPWQTGSGG